MSQEQLIQALAAIALISEIMPFIPGIPNGVAQVIIAAIKAALLKMSGKKDGEQ